MVVGVDRESASVIAAPQSRKSLIGRDRFGDYHARMLDPARRGARTPSLVPTHVLSGLARGEPSVNHMEQIAMDMSALLEVAFPALRSDAPRLSEGGLVTRMRTGGRILAAHLGREAWTLAGASISDTVRGWGAMAIGEAEGLSLDQRLRLIRGYANDPHFAVREWAWLAVRTHIVLNLAEAVALLTSWTLDASANIRRFASEATRPRGVWSVHIPELKRNPQRGLPVLEPLFDDSARYVQSSVGNWLNDAAKTCPDWVRRTCIGIAARESPAGARICHLALRSLPPAP
jgi:3-methyladenine DNA glycosylase AlkC